MTRSIYEEVRLKPIAYSALYQGTGRNRLTTLIRPVMVIPLAVLWFFFSLAACVVAAVSWFTIVLGRGHYNFGYYQFNAGCIHFLARLNGYQYLLTDEYPPFSISERADYPIRTLVAMPKPRYNRLKTLFRFILLIPVVLITYLMLAILAVCALIAWLSILFTGKLPEGLYRPIRSASAWQVRALAYFLLISEDFPPIWVSEEDEAPRFAAVATAALPADPYAARSAPDPYAMPGAEQEPPSGNRLAGK